MWTSASNNCRDRTWNKEVLKLLDTARHTRLIGHAHNSTDTHTPDLLAFEQRGSRRMRYGWIRLPGASSLILLGMLRLHCYRSTNHRIRALDRWRKSRMRVGYGRVFFVTSVTVKPPITPPSDVSRTPIFPSPCRDWFCSMSFPLLSSRTLLVPLSRPETYLNSSVCWCGKYFHITPCRGVTNGDLVRQTLTWLIVISHRFVIF